MGEQVSLAGVEIGTGQLDRDLLDAAVRDEVVEPWKSEVPVDRPFALTFEYVLHAMAYSQQTTRQTGQKRAIQGSITMVTAADSAAHRPQQQ
ncbi:hypothetical protein [Nocardia sp. NPDC004123]